MRYIGNILTEKATVREIEFPEMFNITSDKDSLIQGIPTLIIGWEFTKKIYNGVDIINWEINENTYWTFGFRERRDVYEKRIKQFTKIAIDRISNSVKYEFVNPICDEQYEAKIKNFLCSERKSFYISNDMVYMYSSGDDTVYGISLRDIDYIGRNSKKFLKLIYTSDGSIDSEESNLSQRFKYEVKNETYVIPYITAG